MSGDLPLLPPDEERRAAGMARELEAMIATSTSHTSESFADRVMLAIADEPLPQPVRAFRLALLGGHLRAAAAAIGDAWRTASSGLAPIAVRAQALALVLVVIVASITVAGGATVGAMGLLGTTSPPASSGPHPSAPVAHPTPSPRPEATDEEPSDEPSDGPEASEDPEPAETDKATETPEHETEHSTTRPGTPRPTETDDHEGGSGSGDHTPAPTGTDGPRPSDD